MLFEAGTFAADDSQDLRMWIKHFDHVSNNVGDVLVLATMVFSKGLEQARKDFRLAVRNRRAAVKESEEAKFAPQYKGKLWKVKQDGGAMKEEDWHEHSVCIQEPE